MSESMSLGDRLKIAARAYPGVVKQGFAGVGGKAEEVKKGLGIHRDYSDPAEIANEYGMAMMGSMDLPRRFTTKPIGNVLGDLKTFDVDPSLRKIDVTYNQGTPRYIPNSEMAPSPDRPSYIRDPNLPNRERINVDAGEPSRAALFDGLMAALRQRKSIGK